MPLSPFSFLSKPFDSHCQGSRQSLASFTKSRGANPHGLSTRFVGSYFIKSSLKVLSLTTLLLASTLAPTSGIQANNELPSIGSDQPDKLTVSQEYQLGRAWLRQFRARTSVIYDPIVQSYLEDMTQKLAVETELYERRLNLVAVNANSINAFAVPGGVIGVHSALLTEAHDEDMVASVMAHELAHLSQRHYARRKEGAEEQQLSVFATLLAGLVLSANGETQAGTAAIVGTQAAVIQNQLRFSRLHEQEADAVGFEVLNKAGYDGSGMARMFELLQAQARTQGVNAPEFLLTHPLTQSRIAFARDREQTTDPERQYANLEFQLVRVHALLHQTPENKLPSALQGLQESVPEGLKQAVSLYTDLLLQLKRGQIQQVQESAQKLALQPDHLYFRLIKARVLAASGQIDTAIKLVEAQLTQTPNNYPSRNLLASLYHQSEQYLLAMEVYRKMLLQRPEDPWLWQKLAESAREQQDLLTVYQAKAEEHQLTGDITQALAELKLAREYARGDTLEFARISHRIQELRDTFKHMDFGG